MPSISEVMEYAVELQQAHRGTWKPKGRKLAEFANQDWRLLNDAKQAASADAPALLSDAITLLSLTSDAIIQGDLYDD